MSQENPNSRPQGQGRPQGRPADAGSPRVSRVDASVASPVKFFFASALLWLLVSSVLAVITAVKLHLPGFLNGCEHMTFGRLDAVQRNVFFYGWASNALIGLNLWLLSALGRFEFRNGWIATLGGLIWNLALTAGVVTVLLDSQNAFELLELPRGLAPAFFVAFLLAALWPAVAFARRPTSQVFVSQWYILGASFVLPVVYLLAQLMVLWCPTNGVLQALVHSWFLQNFLLLWLGASALAAVYYFLPKELGTTLNGYYLTTVGFWTLFLFAGWTGPATLLGSPLPLWIQSSGVVAAVMLLIPLTITTINFFGTLSRDSGWSRAWNNTTLRFVAFGVVAYTLAIALQIVFSARSLNAVVRFTAFTAGQQQLLTYAFVSMVIFGAAYFVLPRLTGAFWPSAKLVHLHFWSCALAVVGSVAGSLFFGWTQGAALAAGKPFAETVAPQSALLGTVCAVLFLIGHAAFAINAFGMLTSCSSSTDEGRHA
jgi:cytochrome c oxidase cbb3-type subunit 1